MKRGSLRLCALCGFFTAAARRLRNQGQPDANWVSESATSDTGHSSHALFLPQARASLWASPAGRLAPGLGPLGCPPRHPRVSHPEPRTRAAVGRGVSGPAHPGPAWGHGGDPRPWIPPPRSPHLAAPAAPLPLPDCDCPVSPHLVGRAGRGGPSHRCPPGVPPHAPPASGSGACPRPLLSLREGGRRGRVTPVLGVGGPKQAWAQAEGRGGQWIGTSWTERRGGRPSTKLQTPSWQKACPARGGGK